MTKKTSKAKKEQLLQASYEKRMIEFVNEFLTVDEVKAENWYNVESENLQNLANALNVDHMLFCAIVAVLSPLTNWRHNIKWAVEATKFFLGDKEANPYQGMNTSLSKAEKLFEAWQNDSLTLEFIDNLTGIKTGAFFHNLYDPKNSLDFTIDVWMFRIAMKQWQSATNSFKTTASHKRAIHKAYKKVWASLDLHKYGIMPHNLQAAMWIKIKDAKIAAQWLQDFDSVKSWRSPNGEKLES